MRAYCWILIVFFTLIMVVASINSINNSTDRKMDIIVSVVMFLKIVGTAVLMNYFG